MYTLPPVHSTTESPFNIPSLFFIPTPPFFHGGAVTVENRTPSGRLVFLSVCRETSRAEDAEELGAFL